MKIQYNLKKKVLAGVLAGTAAVMLMAAPYMPVSASNDTAKAESYAAEMQHPGGPGMHKNNGFKDRLAQMVKDGKITQDQADKLSSSMKAFREKQKQERKDWMEQLPNETGISQDTLKTIFRPQHKHMMDPQQMKQRMDQLVKDGKVTQDEATALENFHKTHKPDGKKDGEKLTHEQRLQQVSEATGISTDRLQEIGHMMMPPMRDGQGPKAKMDQLVKDGKITQDEATALENFHKTHKPDMKKDGDKMTHEQRLQQMSEATGISTDRLQEIMTMMRPPMGPGPAVPPADDNQ
jgi:polyhydroxyalkanoate synthesis regulator phasin